jgi:hypothetical protein
MALRIVTCQFRSLGIHNLLRQYSETNVMNFSFNLLRIKGLYMFRGLLTHPQEALGMLCACCVSWLNLGLSFSNPGAVN